MRNICAALLAGGLLLPTAGFADDASLLPGKPAGVQQAQLFTTPVWIVLGLGAIAAGVAVASAHNSPSIAVTTTSP